MNNTGYILTTSMQSFKRYLAKLLGKLHFRIILVTPFVIQILLTLGLISYLSIRGGQNRTGDAIDQLHSEITIHIQNQVEANSEPSISEFESEGLSVQLTPYQDQQGVNSWIAVALPTSQEVEFYDRMVLLALLLGGSVTAITAFLAYSRLIQPLQELQIASNTLAHGKWEEQPMISVLESSDELGQLTSSFHDMTQQVSKTVVTLEKEQVELRYLNQKKDKVLANLSHELQTPLNGMIGLTRSLIAGETGSLPDTTKKNLQLIATTGQRLSYLVSDILDSSRLKHEDIPLRLKPLDLYPLAEAVITLSKPLIGKKPIKLNNQVSPVLPPIWADDNRLQQILYNLVGNAIKFTNLGEITISAQKEEGQLTIAVSDTGIGIASHKLSYIFDSWEDTQNKRAVPSGVTGFGLPLTKKLVELHGGNLQVRSKFGKGSIFTFALPLVIKEKTEENWDITQAKSFRSLQSSLLPTTLNYSSSTPSQALLRSKTDSSQFLPRPYMAMAEGDQHFGFLRKESNNLYHILVVADEAANLQALNSDLTSYYYNVTLAKSSQEALDVVSNNQSINLVLLDFTGPQTEGIELCRAIRESRSANHLPIIMLATNNQLSNLLLAFKEGINDYITKPFSKGELISRIKSHIRLAQLANAYHRFVPNELLACLGKKEITEVELGDQVSQNMSVLFADIRSFAMLSKQMTAEENFKFLNTYLSRIRPIINEYNGFIDKHMGDSTMALFAGPVSDAVDGAIAMQRTIRHYNTHRAKSNYQPINIGIGLHYGEVMIGTIGEQGQIKSTVISSAVGLSARLEELTKLYSASILVSEETIKALEEPKRYHFRLLDKVRVKGHNEFMKIFELLEGDAEEIMEPKIETLDKFETALSHYYQKEFEKAKTAFQEVLSINPVDNAARLYLQRLSPLDIIL